MSNQPAPINILRRPNGNIAVIVGTAEKVEQALELPEQTWWMIMGQISKPQTKQTTQKAPHVT